MNKTKFIKEYKEACVSGDIYKVLKYESYMFNSKDIKLQELFGPSTKKVNYISSDKMSMNGKKVLNGNSIEMAGPEGLLKKAMIHTPNLTLQDVVGYLSEKYNLKDKMDRDIKIDFNLSKDEHITFSGFHNMLHYVQTQMTTLDPKNKNDAIKLAQLKYKLIQAMPTAVAANVCANIKAKDLNGRSIFTAYAGVTAQREKEILSQKEELEKKRQEIEDKYKTLKISFKDISGEEEKNGKKGKGKGDQRLRAFDVAAQKLKAEHDKIQKELSGLDKQIKGLDKSLSIVRKNLEVATANGLITPKQDGIFRKLWNIRARNKASNAAIKAKQQTITFDGKSKEDPGLTTGQKISKGLTTAIGTGAYGLMTAANAMKAAPEKLSQFKQGVKERLTPSANTVAKARKIVGAARAKGTNLWNRFSRKQPGTTVKPVEGYNRFSEAFFAAQDPYFTFINSQIKGFANLDINSFVKYLLSLVKTAEKSAASSEGWLGKILYGISAVVLKGITTITTLIARAADYLLTVFSKPLFADFPKFTVGKAVAIGAICVAVFWVVNKVYKKIRSRKVRESSYLYIDIQSTLAECNVIFDKMNKLVLSEASVKESAKKATMAITNFIKAGSKGAAEAFKVASRASSKIVDPSTGAIINPMDKLEATVSAGSCIGLSGIRELKAGLKEPMKRLINSEKGMTLDQLENWGEYVKFYIKDMKKKKFNLSESEMKEVATYIVKTKIKKQRKLCDYYGME